jgi:hypothetical protein
MLLLVLAIAALVAAGDDGDEVVSRDRARSAFGDGTVLVNDEIVPGVYMATDIDSCSWARLREGREDREAVIAEDRASGQAIVEVVATDVAFRSRGCGRWERFVPPPSPAASFGEGSHAVGTQIRPGRYRSDGGSRCSWERWADFRGERRSVIAGDIVEGRATVTIARTDVGFSSTGCGRWRLPA